VSLTICHFAEESEDLIMNQRMSSIMCHSVEENEDLIMNQRVSSTMYCSAEENEDLIMIQKMNTAVSCSVKEQNDSDEAINVIFEITRIHKFSDLILIFNDIMTLNLADYASYFFKNLIQLICKQQKMNNLIITV
jgi:hypothetical protein